MSNNAEVTEEMLLAWAGSDNTVSELVEQFLPFINGSNKWSLQEFKEEILDYWQMVS